MKKLVAAICVFFLTMLLGWYAGIDYMHRGILPAWAILVAIFFGLLAATCPWLEEKSK